MATKSSRALISSAVKITYPPGCKEINEELTKDELVRRLKLLARAFQDMSQDDNSEHNEFKQLALYLASEFFLDHSSKDARLLVACCIADVFRIFAPNAPYTDNDHLKEIFLFLTQQLRGLEDPDSPSFKRYFYLLENLAWVKSFNICIEMDDNQEIFCSLYRLMFTIVNARHSNKVVNFMLDVMCPLITEADAVSQELLDIILINVIEPHKTQKTHAYNLAKDLIRRTANAIEPYIQTFFNNALMLGKTSESEISGRLYDLIYELNQISPSVLLAVLPQLEFKLKSSEDSERKAVTKLLAKMFSDVGSDLAVQNKPLWLCFLGRFNDIDISVRRLCVQACSDLLVNQGATLSADIEEPLCQRQHDPDENVRMDVVQAIVSAAKKKLCNVTDPLLQAVKERTLDKKFKIRKEALNGLGQIYRKSMMKEEYDKKEAKRVEWIRNKVLYAYYQTNLDDRLLVERILNLNLVPYNLDPDERMRRLFILYGNIDDQAVKALQEIFKIQTNLRNLLRSLLDLHNKPQDNRDVQQLIKQRMYQISRQLPEPNKAGEHLKKLNKLISDDQRVRNSLAKLVSPTCSCKKAEECVKEVLKKTGNPIPQNLVYTTVKTLLERVAPVMIDCSTVQELLKLIDDAVLGMGEICDEVPHAIEKGMKLLQILSLTYPGSFQNEDVFTHLMSFVKHDDDVVSDVTMQIFANVGIRLEHMFPNIFSSLMPVLQKLVKIGTPQQAKHAIRCIHAICRNSSAIFVQIFEHLKKNMELDSPNFLTSLVAIGHMAELCPGEFAAPVKGIVSKFIVKELLMQDRGMSSQAADNWYSDHLVSEETQAKVQSLKMMVRWLLGLKSNANNSGTSTLRLLHTLMLHEGDLMESGRINKPEMARLRLQAGCCMLKLAQEQCYESLITLDQFQATALLLNDPCFQVRVQFAAKLHKGLQTLKLPLSFMSIFCLVANDPLKDRRAAVKQYLVLNIHKRREFLKQNQPTGKKMFQILPDYVLPYAIHLLAHDPDLQDHHDSDTLKNIRECLWFIMEPLITKNDNYSYSFYRKMIENIKQTKDAQNPDNQKANFKLYAVCDLALHLVMTKTSSFVLKDFPAEPVLPAKLFTQADQNYSNTKNYLPEDLLALGAKHKKPIVPGLSPVGPPRQSAVVLHASDKKPPSSPSDLATSPENSEGEEEDDQEVSFKAQPAKRAKTKTTNGAKKETAKPTRGRRKQQEEEEEEEEEEEDMEVEEEAQEEDQEEEEEEEEEEISPAPPAKKSRQSAAASRRRMSQNSSASSSQGKITDFVTRGSKSAENNNKASGDATTTRGGTRGKRGASSQDTSSPPPPAARKNTRTASTRSVSSPESIPTSPVAKKTATRGNVRTAAAKILNGSADEKRSTRASPASSQSTDASPGSSRPTRKSRR